MNCVYLHVIIIKIVKKYRPCTQNLIHLNNPCFVLHKKIIISFSALLLQRNNSPLFWFLCLINLIIRELLFSSLG